MNKAYKPVTKMEDLISGSVVVLSFRLKGQQLRTLDQNKPVVVGAHGKKFMLHPMKTKNLEDHT